jgi:NADH-quinone oxidoreductase subunit M
MILAVLILVPVAGGLWACLVARGDSAWPRWISLAALAIDLVLALSLWAGRSPGAGLGAASAHPAGAARGEAASAAWSGPLAELSLPWIPQLGIRFHLALDGLSLLLVLLAALLGMVAVAASWTEVRQRVGFFHLNLMWVLAGILGVFLAMDLFLFYFFWELMLVPMYFLIAVWGHENRLYAAMKFFIFTQLGGLLMLLAILGLYFLHGRQTHVYTFDYAELLGTRLAPVPAMLLMLGFFLAFAVKLPMIPLHTWLPDAHTEAPTAGSVVLAGLLLKTGAYGMLRFVLPLFSSSAGAIAPLAMTLGVVGILYGAVLALGQTDLKRLVAYTSVSHMGFVLLGIFAGSDLALEGAVVQILCHGASTGALFVLAGALQERTHTRDLRRLGGLWSVAPRMGGAALFFALASLGLPGLGNFVGEFLVLLGTYPRSVPLAVLASLGLIASAVYSLWIIQAAFHGPNREAWKLADLSGRELAMMGVLMAVLLGLGLYPAPVLTAAGPTLKAIRAAPAPRQNLESETGNPRQLPMIQVGSLGFQDCLTAHWPLATAHCPLANGQRPQAGGGGDP